MTHIINLMKQHHDEDDNFWLNRIDDVVAGIIFFGVIGVALS